MFPTSGSPLSLIAALSGAAALVAGRTSPASCRCLPGDSCWPSPEEWDALDAGTGKLFATIPLASPCHVDSATGYDAEKCASLQASWFLPEPHVESSSSIMAPLWTNNSCSPFAEPASPCTLGNYVSYAFNATSAEEYAAVLSFAAEHNLRLAVRNTGHDYSGKSTGAGALALWTLHNKDAAFIPDYDEPHYSGPAFRFGAGVSAHEAYVFADANNRTVVSANQPTVGFIGGYTQGGGHGPLASTFGLAADQVLEWEVVLASGELVVASPSSDEHSDLWWALSGGGGGTYGAVLSATVKAHEPLVLSTGSLTIVAPVDDAKLYGQGIEAALAHLLDFTDAGLTAVWFASGESLAISPIYGPALAKSDLDATVQPLLDDLAALGLEAVYESTQHESFLAGMNSQQQVGVAQFHIGGRLIPRSVLTSSAANLSEAIVGIVQTGSLFSGVSLNVSQHEPGSVGANPYWRQTALSAVVGGLANYTHWGENQETLDLITHALLPPLEDLAPDGAAYLNEADPQQADWQQAFYGEHYERLAAIKSKYDPDGLFYALGAVGSDAWEQLEDGRLCRTK